MKRLSLKQAIRILAVITAVIVLFCAQAVTASAATDGGSYGTANSLTWSYNTDTKQLSLSGSGKMPDFDSASAPWSKYKDSATALVFSGSVSYIGKYAFKGFTKITSLTIPQSVQSTGDYSFMGCSALKTLTIPGQTKTLADRSFADCKALTTVSLSSGIETIGNSVFGGCSALTTISLPNTVKKLGSCAFSNCTALSGVDLGDGLNQIGYRVFENDTKLKSVSIPASLRTCENLEMDGPFAGSSITAAVFDTYCSMIPAYLYSNCKSLTTVEIPKEIGYVGSCAFYGCSGITQLTMPKQVKSMFTDCLSGCTALSKLYVYAEKYYAPLEILKDSSPVIYGYAGTTLQTYAATHGLTFIPFGACGHATRTVVNEGNCKTYGKYIYTCRTCGYNDVSVDVEYGPHNYVTGFTVATCTANRREYGVCSICQDTYNAVIPDTMLGHDMHSSTSSSEDGTYSWTTSFCSRQDFYKSQLNALIRDENGNSLPSKTVVITDPDGNKTEITSNGAGYISATLTKSGVYSITVPGNELVSFRINASATTGAIAFERIVVPVQQCSCRCHGDSVYGKHTRFFYWLVNTLFGTSFKCCNDMQPYK